MSNPYVVPFDLVRKFFHIRRIDGELHASARYADFLKCMELIISGVQVNEQWYLEQNPDIAAACASGNLSAQQHFAKSGYFEGRLPYELKVDEQWYLQQYPDVAEAVAAGHVSSAQDHFAKTGYFEGRSHTRDVVSLVAKMI